MAESGEWYWCMTHDTVEPAGGCREADRLGPYPTREAAANWRQQVAARNEAWDREDEER